MEVSMSTTENDTEAFELSEDEQAFQAGDPEALFGGYSVLSPGVQIIIDGRAVSAVPAD
jgi:hypothetical protein